MLQKYENKLSMYESVVDTCEDNIVIVGSIPCLSDYLSILKTKISLIRGVMHRQALDVKPFTRDKSLKRGKLIKTGMQFVNALVGYAVLSNNNKLEDEVGYSKKELVRLPEIIFIETMRNIYNVSVSNIVGLGEFGLTAAELTIFASEINDYSSALTGPRNAIVQRSTASFELGVLFKETSSLLRNKMDKLVRTANETNNNFINQYFRARKIVNSGRREISLAGKILDSATKVPIVKAKIEIIELNKSYITHKSGHFRFKSLPGKNYTLTISAVNYKTITLLNIPIKEDKTLRKEIYIERDY